MPLSSVAHWATDFPGFGSRPMSPTVRTTPTRCRSRAPTSGANETKALVGLVNAYLDFDFGLPIRPFIGGGAGAAYLSLDTGSNAPLEVDDNAGAFAWNLLAGVGYDITESIALTATYRYLRLEGSDFSGDLAGVDTGDVDVDDVALHEALVGLRYTF